MGSIKTHHTWACKRQLSYEIKGIFVFPSADGHPDPVQCPTHGLTCPYLPKAAP